MVSAMAGPFIAVKRGESGDLAKGIPGVFQLMEGDLVPHFEFADLDEDLAGAGDGHLFD